MAMNVIFEDNLTKEGLLLKKANAITSGRSKPQSFTTLPKGIAINATFLKHVVNGVETPWFVYGEFDTAKGKRYVSGLNFSGTQVMGTAKYDKFFVDLSDAQMEMILAPENAGKTFLIHTQGYSDPATGVEKVIAKFDSVNV
jgi:hypothetical protein